jgi:DNA-binding transcriptional LysR family regulator
VLDLNEIALFAAVVEHNGFSSAARALNCPKSSISRQVGRLEARLGVRLLERSTRRIRLTEVGGEYYARCKAALGDLEAAGRDAAVSRSDPVGVIRIASPNGIARQILARIIPSFMARYPGIRLQIQATNQAIDLLKERIDLAIRARAHLSDESLTMRKLGVSRLIFVTSPAFVVAHPIPSEPAAILKLPFLSFLEQTERPTWLVRGPAGATRKLTFDPVLWTSEFDVLIGAACAGAGVALLPAELVQQPLRDARLMRILPEWHCEDVIVFPTARGLRPAVRVFIDYLVANSDVGTRRE